MGKLQPQQFSFIETAPYRATASIICPAPALAVFSLLKDNEASPQWVKSGATSVRTTSKPKHGLGSTRSVTFFGFVTVEEKFVAWEEPTLWAFTGIGSTIIPLTKIVEGFRMDPIDDKSCRVTYLMGTDFPRPLQPFGKIMVKILTITVRSILKRLVNEVLRRQAQGRTS